MVVSPFGRGDVDVVTPSLRHFASLLQRSLGGLPPMKDFAVLALRLYRESHFFFFLFFLFFFMISAWVLKAWAKDFI